MAPRMCGSRRGPRLAAFALAAFSGMGLLPPFAPVLAAGATFDPLTKVTITVVQWVGATGEFRRWDALSGTLTFAPDDTLTIPVIGTVNATGLDSTMLAQLIAQRVKERLGLAETPYVTVDIVEYPPIYVIGDVSRPGEFRYLPGTTVLQALAMAGDAYRPSDVDRKAQLGLVGDLKQTRSDILRTEGRIARLDAERAGVDAITFPASVTDASDRALAQEIMTQERLVFDARRNGLERQMQTLAELDQLLEAEVGVLQEKSDALDAQITQVDEELSGVKTLVDRGVSTVSRRSELERLAGSIRSDRLDQITAAMRARQGIKSAERERANLVDERQAEVAKELQDARATLEQLLIRQTVLERQVTLGDGQAQEDAPETLLFTVVRSLGGSSTFVANELTELRSGDVLKVVRERTATVGMDALGAQEAIHFAAGADTDPVR